MPNTAAERRAAPRFSMVLAAELVELPCGAKSQARTADISRSGCYIDTLNPNPQGSIVRLRITHHQEVFQALGTVVYVSPGLGMGIHFNEIANVDIVRLASWLNEVACEF